MKEKAVEIKAEDLSGDQLVQVLAALASPHRLRIMAALRERPVHVSQLARDVQIGRPLVHMHLRKLEDAGLVKGRLELAETGRAMKYFEVTPFLLRLTPELFAEAAKTISTAAEADDEKEKK